MKINSVNRICLSPSQQVIETAHSNALLATAPARALARAPVAGRALVVLAPARAPRNVQLAPSLYDARAYVRTTTVSTTRTIRGWNVRVELTARELASADSADRTIGRLCALATVILAVIGVWAHIFG